MASWSAACLWEEGPYNETPMDLCLPLVPLPASQRPTCSTSPSLPSAHPTVPRCERVPPAQGLFSPRARGAFSALSDTSWWHVTLRAPKMETWELCTSPGCPPGMRGVTVQANCPGARGP